MALLDTHILLWALADGPALTGAQRAILSAAAEIHVSAATSWEISIRRALGELVLGGDPTAFARAAGCPPLPVIWEHGDVAGRLPIHHSDPFDRLLIAQARLEDLAILSADRAFASYALASA